MQPVARGESRRRPHTPEPSRRRRTPSSSHITPPSRLTHLNSVLDSLAYFAAAAPHAPLILLAFPAALFAALLLLLSRPSLTAVRLTLRARSLPVLSLVHVYHLLATLLAVRLIGPVRALIALGAHPTAAHLLASLSPNRRRRSLAATLFTCAALAFLVYDATGGRPGVRVRERMMHTTAGRAVHDRIQNLSHRIKIRSLPFYTRRTRVVEANSADVSLPDADPEQPNPPVDPPPHPMPPPDHNVTAPTKQGGKDSADGQVRRRPMAIVKGEQPGAPEDVAVAQPPPDRAAAATNQSLTNASSNAPGATVDTSPTGRRTVEENMQTESRNLITRSPPDSGPPRDSEPQLTTSWLSASLGVFMAVTASLTGRAASDMRDRVINELGDWSTVCTALYVGCSLILCVGFVAALTNAFVQGEAMFDHFLTMTVPRSFTISLCILVLPVMLQVQRKGLLRRSRVQRAPKLALGGSLSSISASLVDLEARTPTTLSLYLVLLATLLVVRVLSVPAHVDTLTISSYLAAFLLLVSSKLESPRSESSVARQRGMTGSSGDLSAYLGKGAALGVRSVLVGMRTSISTSLRGVKDLAVHARSNKASWQVLNFLILQTGMAVVELVYATITKSTGLFSISADNFFCSVALAIGLVAIRMSSRKPSATFTYGYSRVESVCGFANGILLIYVVVLVVLEAFERLNDDAAIAFGRAFSVCLIGVVGNLLGLYFFPPESRRENHNVQGIYLHIWANTLAFASMAISTAITAAFPKWQALDLLTAALVALGMAAFALPLLVRSSRLLLLISLPEKGKGITSTKERLNQISGVTEVSGLRVWNLTPNSLVGSVRLKVATAYEGGDAEVLSRSRAVFTMIGVSSKQCTIQITRVESGQPEQVVYLHKRSRSALPDTGINVEMLSSAS